MEFFCSLVSVLFYAVSCKGNKCGCMWMKMVNLGSRWHCTNHSCTLLHCQGCGLWKVHKWCLYSSQANGGPWKNPNNSGVRRVRRSECTTLDKMLLFSCKKYRHIFKCQGARLAKERSSLVPRLLTSGSRKDLVHIACMCRGTPEKNGRSRYEERRRKRRRRSRRRRMLTCSSRLTLVWV